MYSFSSVVQRIALGIGLMLAGLTSVGTAQESLVVPDVATMAGEMLLVGFRGTEVSPQSPVAQALAARQVGGVILFSRDLQTGGNRNVESAAQVRTLTAQIRAAAPGPVFIAVDQEGGRVQRLSAARGFPSFPSARSLGQGEVERTREQAAALGEVLSSVGINLNFAPVVDLHFPKSPAIGDLGRAFHHESAVVTAHARAFIQGMAEQGLVACLKHFPGHGSAGADTHKGYVDSSATWSPAELEPYRALLAEGFEGMIMVAHVVLRPYGDVPADLNPAIISGLLRGELGWDGVVVTDDLHMGAITDHYSLEESILLAVNAGADLLVLGNNMGHYDPHLGSRAHAALVEHVRSGRITPERIQQSWRRIHTLKQRIL